MRLLLQVMGVAAILLILSLSLNAQFWADDFYIYNSLKEFGITEFMWMQYKQWDGRFVSLNALIQLNLIRSGSAPLAVGVWSIMFLLAVIFVRKIFIAESGLTYKVKNRDAILQISLLFCLMWLGFSGHISETLYWATGGIYTMSLAMSFGFIWMYLNRPDKVSFLWLAGGSAFSLMLGLAGVIVSFPVLVFMVIEVILHSENKKTSGFWIYPLVWGLAITVSTLFNIAAPGNFLRASLLDTSFNGDLVIMAVNAVKISLRYILLSLTAVCMAVLAVFLIPENINSMGGKIMLYKISVITKEYLSYKVLLREGKWLIVAFSGILPMLVIPDFAGGRTAVFFMAYLFLWIWLFFSRLLRKEIADQKPWLHIMIPAKCIRVSIILFFVSIISVAAIHFYQTNSIKKQVIAREEFLASHANKADTIWVKPIIVSQVPFSAFFYDLQDAHYARYYGFKYVLIDNSFEGTLPEYYCNPPW